MIGYIGLVMLLGGYSLMLTRYRAHMVPVNAVASIILTIHAYILGDIPFIIVNGLVSCILCATWIQDRKKHGEKRFS